MTFADYAYVHPDVEAVTAQFEGLLAEFAGADAGAQVDLVRAAGKLRARWSTQQSLCHIRHTIDTTDAFYEAENAFFDAANPTFEALENRFREAVIASPHRAAIAEAYGRQFIRRTEVSRRSFDASTLGELAEENRLASAYTKVKARAEIAFRGRTYNLSSIHPLTIDRERAVRAGAARAVWAFYAEREAELGELFGKLVDVRTRIARAMGRDDFVALAYDRMGRTDYGPEQVARFRDGIRRHVVPLATELYERQRARLGLDALHFHDEGIGFPEGNPAPQGSPEDTVAAASDLYAELSEETAAFFTLMRERELMDLVARDGKATGGYCTYLHQHCVPFIFSNFNGTSGDVDVLTHELGHAFQMYESRRQPVMEYILPTYEACEIHSMSMEFFAYPWMESFFGDDAERYRAHHLETAVKYLPYIAAVDEFQHEVYARPGLDHAGRLAVWRRLEATYLPHRRYGHGLDLPARGGVWVRQSHIFQVPFYYIDYALAQVCALQFLRRDRDNHREAWGDYLALCRAGGSESFLDLVDLAHLRSPFDEGALADLATQLRPLLGLADVGAGATKLLAARS